jgi:hypothetical protein
MRTITRPVELRNVVAILPPRSEPSIGGGGANAMDAAAAAFTRAFWSR